MRMKLLAGALLVTAFAAASPVRADIITTGVCTVGTQPRACVGLYQYEDANLIDNFAVVEAYNGNDAYLVFAGRSAHTGGAWANSGVCASRYNPQSGFQDTCVVLYEEDGSVRRGTVILYDAGVCYIVYADGTYEACSL